MSFILKFHCLSIFFFYILVDAIRTRCQCWFLIKIIFTWLFTWSLSWPFSFSFALYSNWEFFTYSCLCFDYLFTPRFRFVCFLVIQCGTMTAHVCQGISQNKIFPPNICWEKQTAESSKLFTWTMQKLWRVFYSDWFRKSLQICSKNLPKMRTALYEKKNLVIFLFSSGRVCNSTTLQNG